MKNILKASFFKKIVLPSFLAIILFIISVFAFVIPAFENNAIVQKKEMLNELTNTAWSILNKYNIDYEKGILSLEEAQKKAISEIEALRYGSDKKDYFWITDFQPKMIMHPYVHELNGKNLKDFADPDGKKLFIEAVNIAKTSGEGFISYKWQQNDDTKHIVPKLSFVKKFTAWKWIVGTGIYLHDVETEIASLTNKLLLILLVITLIIISIVLFITYQSLNIENRKREVEKQLQESKEKYKSLIESTTEGVILLLNSQISYSNAFIQNWLQYSTAELQNLNLKNIFSCKECLDFEKIKSETRLEIELIKKDRTKTEAVLTILPVKFADKEGLLLTFRDTSEQRIAKIEIEDYKTQLQNISNYSNVGLFRFSLKNKNKLMEFNQNLISILGYSSENELKKTPILKLFANANDFKNIFKKLNENKNIANHFIQVRKKDNSLIDIKLSIFLSNSSSDENLICDGIIEAKENTTIQSENNVLNDIYISSLSQNYQAVTEFSKPVVSCQINAKMLEAIEIMIQNSSSYILIMQNEKCLGIITQSDILNRFLKSNSSENSLASEFMSSPVIFVNENAQILEASSIFEHKQISTLVIKNSSNQIVGVIEKSNLIGKFINPEEKSILAIDNSQSINELAVIRQSISNLIKPLISVIGNIQTPGKIISNLNDNITSKIIQHSIKEMGEAPVKFAFILIGSGGREELAFNSDQDNAIIYDDCSEVEKEKIEKYFAELSSKICTKLDQSGLPFCSGGYMANNTKWCQPISQWKNYFSDWIVNAEPVNILNISVFFDLRFVFGEQKLFEDLENYVFESLKGRTAFFYFLAQNIAGFKPPINVFGNIITENARKNNDTIDIKNCVAAVVNFVRIYALHNNIKQKGTLNRIVALKKLEVFSANTSDELLFQYNYLMQLRLQQQLQQIAKKQEITNSISPKRMTEIEQVILKKIFAQMNNYQEKLSASFMSSYKG